MNFATPLLFFLLFLCVGYALAIYTPLSRFFPGRAAAIWSVAFATGALASVMSAGVAQLMR